MQMGRHDETNSHFLQFCECAPKQQSKIWTEILNSNADKNLNNTKRALKIAFPIEHTHSTHHIVCICHFTATAVW
jgi:hypothetical protein